MGSGHIIFISAVSDEFHKVLPQSRHPFLSYRGVVKQAFRILAPHYEVIVQEDLPLGVGDLLETLDHEINRSLFVIHLVGDMSGFAPEPAPLRELHRRRPDLLDRVQELRDVLADRLAVTYTQWELYFAFYHRRARLILYIEPTAPRSPLFGPTPADQTSQAAHRRRIEALGGHRGPAYNQGDVAMKSVRSFLHFRTDPRIDPDEPTEHALAEAWAHREQVVEHLVRAIEKPNPRAVPVIDPANSAAFVAAVSSAAERWKVNLATIVSIAARYEEQVRAAAESRPTAETLYDLAFAEFAFGDYTASSFTARRAVSLALELLQKQSIDESSHREAALNALLLLFEVARAAHDAHEAMAAAEEAGALVDKQASPLLWAEIHESLADLLLDHAKLDRADSLISDIIDIREEHQSESHPDLARTLILWTKLLYARANYFGVASVAQRAERIYTAQDPPDLLGLASALNSRGSALFQESRFGEAELLLQQALAILEEALGSEHPHVANSLNSLAELCRVQSEYTKAEPLYNRSLAIREKAFGPEHPNVAQSLDNLAALYRAQGRYTDAEPLYQRALSIWEQSLGSEHPDFAQSLNNLAVLYDVQGRYADAEPLYLRSLAIRERALGPEHPMVATCLDNLAGLYHSQAQYAKAEPLYERALGILEQTLGPEHPKVAQSLNNLAEVCCFQRKYMKAEPLFQRRLTIWEHTLGPFHTNVATSLNSLAELYRIEGKYAKAEALHQRALAIWEHALGPNHPDVATSLNNLAMLYNAQGKYAKAEPLHRRALAIVEEALGPEHPLAGACSENYALCLRGMDRVTEAMVLEARAIAIRAKRI
jgi:tetratricopeptide (TPR) repeat protein